MTNKEALQETAQIVMSDVAIEKAFLDAGGGLISSGTYSSSNEEAIDTIAIQVLSNFLAADISEGEYSIKYNSSIEKKIARLKAKWGIDVVDDEPTIQDVSNLW